MMLPVLMLILSYQIILKSKFSTQSCVHCAFLFNVDNNCIYKHWLIWTQWWQAWNWFPLCNSSDQINQFALHCWFDLSLVIWLSGTVSSLHRINVQWLVNSDTSVYLWLPIRFEFYFSWNIFPHYKQPFLVFALHSSQPLSQYVCTHLFISLKTTWSMLYHANDEYWIRRVALLWSTELALFAIQESGSTLSTPIYWMYFWNSIGWNNFDLNETQHSISEFWRE